MRFHPWRNIHKSIIIITKFIKRTNSSKLESASWGTWLAGKEKEVSLRLRLKEPIDGESLMFCGIEFQTVGVGKLCDHVALAVKGTCRRFSEEERRGLGELLKLISDER